MNVTKIVVIFIFGLLTGMTLVWSWSFLNPQKVSPTETALGEILYEDLLKYPGKWDIQGITRVMRELSIGNRLPQTKEKRDRFLIELATTESENIAQNNLDQANIFLSNLSQKEGLISVVNDMVYVEVLEEGTGENVHSNDVISVSFKQFDTEGQTLKDTLDNKYTIHLSRMIKGFKLGIDGAKVGERRKIYIHPDYGFGKIGRSEEPNQLLIYEVVIHSKVG